jgi:hypothetical protein
VARPGGAGRAVRCGAARGLLGTALLALTAAAAAHGQVRADETPLEDLLELVQLEHQLLAIDAEGGGQTRVDLELGEQVVWSRSRGRVGVVLTDRRVLAVAASSAAWQEARYWRTERPPSLALLGDRVALIETSERVLGFTGGSGNLVEYRLGLREHVVEGRTGANAAVVVTNRKALGLSPQAGGFFPVALQIKERLVELTPRSNLATVRTDRRLLIFRGPTGTWESRQLDLADSR